MVCLPLAVRYGAMEVTIVIAIIYSYKAKCCQTSNRAHNHSLQFAKPWTQECWKNCSWGQHSVFISYSNHTVWQACWQTLSRRVRNSQDYATSSLCSAVQNQQHGCSTSRVTGGNEEHSNLKALTTQVFVIVLVLCISSTNNSVSSHTPLELKCTSILVDCIIEHPWEDCSALWAASHRLCCPLLPLDM